MIRSASLTSGFLIVFSIVAALLGGYCVASGQILVAGVLALVTLTLIILSSRSFWILLAFVFLLPLETAFLSIAGGTTITRIMGILVFLVWGTQLVFKRQKIIVLPPIKWAAVLIGWAALSYFWAWNQSAAIDRLLTVIQLFALSVLVCNVARDQQKLEQILIALFCGCLLAGLLGLLGIGTESGDLLTLNRQGPKEYASYIGISFLIASIMMTWGPPRNKFLFGTFGVISIIPLFASGERGVVLALGLSWVAIALVMRQRNKGIFFAILILGLLYITPAILMQMDIVPTFVLGRFNLMNLVQTGGSGRDIIWAVGLAMIRDNLLIGTGLANFPVAYLHYRFLPIVGISGNQFANMGYDPHNDWMGITGELGLVGLFLFQALLIKIGWDLKSFMDKHSDPHKSILAIMVFSLFIYSLSIGLSATFMWRKVYWLILTMAMLVPVLGATDQHRSNQEK